MYSGKIAVPPGGGGIVEVFLVKIKRMLVNMKNVVQRKNLPL
jgi:hypothetical protein